MQPFEQLEYDHFYHIYNHAVGGRDLFCDDNNYEYFLELYDKYISPIAETYAWVLMKNHFHFLVRIRKLEECLNLKDLEKRSRKITHDKVSNPVVGNFPSLQFSKLFNSYAQAYNKYRETRGTLFERPFRRKLIVSDEYLQQLVIYIHNNPVHHGFCEHPLEYHWSSYLTFTSNKATKLKREEVIEWFCDRANFIAVHKQAIKMEDIAQWLEM